MAAVAIDYERIIPRRIAGMPPSGIRKFFDLLDGMTDVTALTVGQPDFVTPWHIREAGIESLEKGIGQKNFDTAGKSGEQNRRAPAGRGFRSLFRCPAGQALRRATPTQVQPVPPGFSPGDARGEAPCMK